MGGGGSSWNPIQDIKEAVSNSGKFTDTVFSGIVNYATGGLVGYENGKFKDGAGIQGFNELMGGMNGGNAARKETMKAADKLEAEKKGFVKQTNDNNKRRQVQDLAASNMTRSRGSSRGTGGVGSVESNLNNSFLGL